MSGKRDFNLKAFLDSFNQVVSVPITPNPEITPEPEESGEVSPLPSGINSEIYIEATSSSMNEPLSQCSLDVLCKYAQCFAEFIDGDFLSFFNEYKSNDRFTLSNREILLETYLLDNLNKVVEYGERYGEFFPFQKLDYESFSDAKKLGYIFGLCNNLKIFQEQERVLLFKKIIEQAIQKYRSNGKSSSIFKMPPERIEENYVDKLKILISVCESIEEVFYAFGFFYNYILPINPGEAGIKERTGNDSFIAFFLREMKEAKWEDSYSPFSLLGKIIKREDLRGQNAIFTKYDFELFFDYHENFLTLYRKRCVQAFSLLNNNTLVDKFRKALEAEKEFVLVKEEVTEDWEIIMPSNKT